MLKDVAVQKNEIDGIRQSSHPDIKAPLGTTTDCIEGPHSLKGNLEALQNENCLGDCFENCPETCPEMVITTCMDNLAVSTCPEVSSFKIHVLIYLLPSLDEFHDIEEEDCA